MEFINQQTITNDDPWHGKAGTLLTITLTLLLLFAGFAVYDGVTFYARVRQLCAEYPDRAECKNFNIPENASNKPALGVVLDYANGKYAIQTGAYKSEENAKSNAAQLQSYGIQPRIIKVTDAKRRVWHQVHIGRFEAHKTATQTAERLKQKGIIQDFTITGYRAAK